MREFKEFDILKDSSRPEVYRLRLFYINKKGDKEHVKEFWITNNKVQRLFEWLAEDDSIDEEFLKSIGISEVDDHLNCLIDYMTLKKYNAFN